MSAVRWVAGVVSVALLVTLCGVVGASADPAMASSGGRSSHDSSINRADCALLGRRYVAGAGCSRYHCVGSAFLDKGLVNAEKCALPQQHGYGFGAPVDFERCHAMHRRWVEQVNWCAANPDRQVKVIKHAAQCTGRYTTYLSHDETEGNYDECLRPKRYRQLRRIAKAEGVSVAHAAYLRSEASCGYRPGHVFAHGICVDVGAPAGTPGSTVLIGDSIAYRGSDELAAGSAEFVLDAYPGRRMSDLEERVAWFRRGYGEPSGIILELGTNSAPSTHEDLVRIVSELPTSTRLMLVVPYRAKSKSGRKQEPFTVRYGQLMRSLASQRPGTCVADWAAEVDRRPELLVDGVHPTRAGEDVWARWITRSWYRCDAG